jgi:hypothetical protein
MLRVLLKLPALPEPIIREIEATYEEKQKLVGGSLQCVSVPGLDEHKIDLWLNEEGKFLDLPWNFQLPWGDPVAGPAFFASVDNEGAMISLSEEQERITRAFLKQMVEVV